MPKSNVKSPQAAGKNNGYLVRLILKIVPEWITPNAISLLRLIMIPFIVAYLAWGYFSFTLILFVAAALLDKLDGILARAREQISEWGLILDPLADKLLIMAIIAFLLVLYPFKLLIIYVFVFELLVLLAAAVKISRPTVPGAPIKTSNLWGKSKMLAQVVGLCLALAWLVWPAAPLLYGSALIIWLSLALQIMSAMTYL